MFFKKYGISITKKSKRQLILKYYLFSAVYVVMYLYFNLFGFLQVRLPPEVNRILYIRNLPYKISAEEMYDIFGKYGAIRQIRV